MTELKVTIEDALKAYKNTSEEGKRLLESLYGKEHFKLSITDRIKTFEDVLNELEIDHDDFIESHSYMSPDVLAYLKLRCIVEVLNEGWTPKWGGSYEYKYYPWFKMGSSSGVGFSFHDYGRVYSSSRVGSRLCFKSSELATYAAKQFEDIYKDFFTK